MKRKVTALLLCAMLAVSLTACGKSGGTDTADTTDATATGSEISGEEVSESISEAEPEEEAEPETIDFDFSQVSDLEFYFSSGAGGWSTVLQIAEDGSFTGYYHDSDMGDSGDEYPDGTYYECSFTGCFLAVEALDGYTYRLEIRDMVYDEPGVETIEDGIRYITAEPYGLEQADSVYLYLPGKPITSLPEEYLDWVRSAMEENHGVLSFAGLYEEVGAYGFSSYEVATEDALETDELTGEVNTDGQETSLDDFREGLAEAEASSDDMTDRLENDTDLSQTDMNNLASDYYELWDGELNELWGILKSTLGEDEMDTLRSEQRQWIQEKESAAEEEASQWEGGSMAPMAEYMVKGNMTKDRVYELMDYLE